jgi:hypothetical protein
VLFVKKLLAHHHHDNQEESLELLKIAEMWGCVFAELRRNNLKINDLLHLLAKSD